MTPVDMSKAKKSNQELFSYYFMNKISIPMVKFLGKYTRITPNQITIFSFPVGILGSLLLLLSGYTDSPYAMRVVGAIIIFLFYYLDTLDGKLARVRKKASILGKLLDGMVMFAVLPLIFFSLAFGLRSYTAMVFGSLAMMCYIIQFLMSYHFKADIKPAFSGEEVLLVKGKSKLQRAYGAAIFFPLLIIATAFNKPLWLLIFYATFGNLFWILVAALQIKATRAYEKKHR